jgi:murein DD-endopeptidase MepM/ murein hydrolase activator NlpD
MPVEVLMMNQSSKMERFLDFLAGRGFYIILGLCVIAIGVSGYVLLFSDSSPPEEDALMLRGTKEPAATIAPTPTPIPRVTPYPTAPVIIAPPETESVPVIKPEPDVPSPPPEPAGTAATAKPAPAPAPTAVPEPSAPVFARPVNGEILRDYDMENLVYHKTLGLWRVHAGVDVAAAAGTVVCAAGDGKVVDIYNDPLYGLTVKVDHGNGLMSMYSNLSERVSVVIDQLLKLGDAIGTVGETAIAEIEESEESHLCFSMTLNGTPVDPKEYLTK